MELLARRAEDAGLNASAPPQQADLDGWLLRLSPGKAKRSRCVNALAEGTLPLHVLLGRCRQAFAQAQLPLIVRITPFTQPADLDSRLAALGWAAFDSTDVMLRPTLHELPANTALEAIEPSSYAEIIGALRGSKPREIAAHAERMHEANVRYQGFILRDGDELAACGQIVVEDGLVGLYDVFTPPAQRGRGHAARLCSALLHQARAQGASAAYLQVTADNLAAQRVYARLGFSNGYRYHYRSDDPDAAA